MSSMLLYVAVLLLVLLVKTTESGLSEEQRCSILEGGALLEVAEKICEFCHEITSHEKPNMRSECRYSRCHKSCRNNLYDIMFNPTHQRSFCFSTDHFRQCLNIFSSPTTTSQRNTRSRHRIRHTWT